MALLRGNKCDVVVRRTGDGRAFAGECAGSIIVWIRIGRGAGGLQEDEPRLCDAHPIGVVVVAAVIATAKIWAEYVWPI